MTAAAPQPISSPPFLAVLDFEATCDQKGSGTGWKIDQQEIIEFPTALLCTRTRQVVDTFHHFVRPVHQPQLTPFCTQLTSIEQHQVDDQAEICEIAERFHAWVGQHGLTPQNCSVVTCGDWDLRRMWPRQVGLSLGLGTPAIFREWINVKRIFEQHMGTRARSMMSMLAAAEITHQGRHHLGIDDVRNITRLVVWLLDQGAHFTSTWTARSRADEHQVFVDRLQRRRRSREHKHRCLVEMPAHVRPDVREKAAAALARLDREIVFIERCAAVFSD